MTREETTQSKWTWDRLRSSDRRLLLRYAVNKHGQKVTMLDNHDLKSWSELPTQVKESLGTFAWDVAFRAA